MAVPDEERSAGHWRPNFGGQQVTYPKELEKAVLSLGDELAKRYAEHQERVPKIEEAGPQKDDDFDKAIRQWLRDNTGLYPAVEIEEPVLHGLHELRDKTREQAATLFSSWGIDFWFAEELKELLRSGVHIQYFTYDTETGRANFSLRWSIESHGGSEGFDKSTMPFLLPRPDPGSSEADIRRDVEEAQWKRSTGIGGSYFFCRESPAESSRCRSGAGSDNSGGET